jgi:hypothetical protein
VLYVYTDPTTSPTTGTLAMTKSGVITEAGYHTVRFDTPVALTSGHKFSVVVRLTTPGYNYPIPLERPYSGYDSGATASAGQSYMSSNGSAWSDVAATYSNANVCVKAFTSSSTVSAPGVLSVSPAGGLTSSGNAGGPFSPASQVYTLSNTGGSTISWTAAKSAAWVTLSPTSGSLASGANAAVTVTVNSGANSLTAGSYSDTVTFANATTGSGNTTRAVQLTVTTPPQSYVETSAVFSWISPDTHSRLSLTDNSASAAIAIPFTFRFYGKNYTSIYVGSNGLISFGSAGASASVNTAIPLSSTPNAALYPYWDDLNPGAVAGSVRTGVVGVSPNRKMVVSWVGVPLHANTAVKLTFQAVLCEGSNDIVFQYLNSAISNASYGAGAGATIGIENETGTQGIQHSKDRFGAVYNNYAIRYGSPQAASPTRTSPWLRLRF